MPRLAIRNQTAVVLIVALVAAAVGTLLLQLWIGQREEIDFTLRQTEERSRQLARAMNGRLQFLVRTADFVLLEGRRTQASDPARFPELVRALSKSFPESAELQMTVANAAGDVVYSYRPLAGPVNFADRDYFRTLRTSPDRLIITGPLVGRVIRNWIVLFVRPVLRDGRFEGVITLSMSPKYLSQVLAEVELPGESNVSIFDLDGRYVARNRDLEQVLGKHVAPGRPFVGSDPPARGTFTAMPTIGRGERIFSWERIPGTRLVVVVGLEAATELGPIERRYRERWIALLTLLAALLVSGGGIAYLARRLQRQRAALSESEARYRNLAENLERRVEERTRELEVALKEMDAFSYSVSHDLRAPLRAIGAFAHMVREREAPALSDEGRRRLATVEANAVRMGQLVDDLLSLARLSRAPLAREALDVGALAAAVAAELRPQFPAARIEVGSLPPAHADPTLLRQILLNLVGNALKYSAKRPDARVEVLWDDQQGAYAIRDNGAGFDMQYAGKLFGAFERLHPESEFPGTGIGLAIVKRAVERHGGRVWAEAAPGAGATFYFALGESGAE